ncbi:MAG: hypothetical protein ACRD0K_08015 [Egibacteraceae bacterium]
MAVWSSGPVEIVDTSAEQVGFPYAAQAWRILREVSILDGTARSCETVYGLTSATSDKADPARLLDLVRASEGSPTGCAGFTMSRSMRTARRCGPGQARA